MKVGDVISLPGTHLDRRSNLYRIVGIYIGCLRQVSLVEIEPLDQAPQANPILVPVGVVEHFNEIKPMPPWLV
jgi:hypothetical protein